MGELLSIGEVARRAGLAASALRYYEREGLLPKAERRGGKRWYGPEALDRLAVVRFASAAGFTVREMRLLLAPGAERAHARWGRLARAKRAELRERAAQLRAMERLLGVALRCHCLDVQACGRALRRAEGRARGRRPRPGATPA